MLQQLINLSKIAIETPIFLSIPKSNKMPTMANSTAPSPAGVMGKVVKREEAKAINMMIVKGRKKFKEKVTK